MDSTPSNPVGICSRRFGGSRFARVISAPVRVTPPAPMACNAMPGFHPDYEPLGALIEVYPHGFAASSTTLAGTVVGTRVCSNSVTAISAIDRTWKALTVRRSADPKPTSIQPGYHGDPSALCRYLPGKSSRHANRVTHLNAPDQDLNMSADILVRALRVSSIGGSTQPAVD
jgi:hypothetical protein